MIFFVMKPKKMPSGHRELSNPRKSRKNKEQQPQQFYVLLLPVKLEYPNISLIWNLQAAPCQMN